MRTTRTSTIAMNTANAQGRGGVFELDRALASTKLRLGAAADMAVRGGNL
jgi:hypothetical protein